MPTTPGMVTPEELAFIKGWGDTATFHQIPALAKALLPRLNPLVFQPKPYEIFSERADYFGDGSLIIVKLPGHTPGSLGAILNLSPTRRIFHIGDATHDMKGLTERLEKGVLTRATDYDKDRADQTVARLNRLYQRDKTLTFLPAHDRAQWVQIFGGDPPRCISN